VRVHAGDTGRAADAVHDPADLVPVQHAAVVGGQPLAAADVLKVGRSPGSEELDQFRVQWHVPVGAELAERDVQPVPGADAHDRISIQVRQFPGPHPGPG